MRAVDERFLGNQITDIMGHLEKDIQSRKLRLSLFLGAGISKNPPSNLPLANEIRNRVLKKLFADEQLDAGTLSRFESYPFEAFVQVIAENSNFLDYLITMYEMGEPNKNHMFVAKLVKEGYVRGILTTNFDLQLEKALRKEGLIPERDFKVISNEDGFAGVDPETINTPVIFKIHGSVNNRESVRTTMNLISAKSLLESRQKIIEYFLKKGEVILILGYSFSDEFDVNPMLRGLKSAGEILWIKHSKEDCETKSTIQKLQYPLEGLNGQMINCNTDRIIDHVWSELLKEEWSTIAEPSSEWSKHIEYWNERLSLNQRLFIAAKLLDNIREPSRAEELYKQSLELTRERKDERRVSYILNELAIICQQKGNYDEAENLCKQSLEIKKKLRDQTRFPESLYNLANIYQLKGDYDAAEKCYSEGLETDRSCGNESGISRAVGNLAIIEQLRGNCEKAERLHHESLEIKKRLGDQVGVAYTLYHLAIIEQDRGSYEKAEQLYERSLEIRKKLEDKRGISRIFHNLATIQQYKGNYDEAENLHKQGLAIDEKLEDLSAVHQTLNNLGGIQVLRGNYDKAEGLLNESLQVARRLGDQPGISCSLHNLAIIQKHKGEYVEARKLHQKGLEIDAKLRDQSATAQAFYDLADIEQLTGNYVEAKRLNKKALEIVEKLGDKRGTALVYRQLGSLYEKLGETAMSSTHYAKAANLFDEIGDKHHGAIVRQDLNRVCANR